MLVGSDPNQIIERRLQGAGCHVVRVNDSITAIDQARHEYFDVAVLVSSGPLINVAETIFNLRDINRSMEIIIVVERMGKDSSRFLRPLLQHPIERTRILTRRQLQKHLHASTTPSPPGKAV
jgi:hypothetical protein